MKRAIVCFLTLCALAAAGLGCGADKCRTSGQACAVTADCCDDLACFDGLCGSPVVACPDEAPVDCGTILPGMCCPSDTPNCCAKIATAMPMLPIVVRRHRALINHAPHRQAAAMGLPAQDSGTLATKPRNSLSAMPALTSPNAPPSGVPVTALSPAPKLRSAGQPISVSAPPPVFCVSRSARPMRTAPCSARASPAKPHRTQAG